MAAEQDEDPVLLSKENGLAWVTLNRPNALNAINNGMRSGLQKLMREADSDPDVRVIVIKGAGSRAFCAGADLKERSDRTPMRMRQERLLNHWISAFDCTKPTIAAIHGYCLGGGLEIATACDIRIAASDAVIGFPEIERGRVTGTGGSQRLVRIVGLGRALDLVLTCERISGEEAFRIGLVSRSAPPERLLAEVTRVAERMAQFPQLALQLGKESVRRGAELELLAGSRLEGDLSALLATTIDRSEAIEAFREKRAPKLTEQ